MASVQAHFLDFLFRVQIKRKLKGVVDVAKARAVLQGAKLPVPVGVHFTPDTIGGIEGEWVRASGKPALGVLLYLHGGGYFACSPLTYRPVTGAFAKLGFDVFVPDYRLAPEHPFPAAVEDAVAVWKGLLAMGHSAESLVVAGDSAGGGLSLAMMLSLREQGVALPAACGLLSPWTDLAVTGETIVSNAKADAMFHAMGLKAGGAAYVGDADVRDPLASPVYADLTGLPPLIIHAGDREILRADSTRLAERAKAAGVAVDIKIWPVVPHVWQLAQFVPEARQSLAEIAAFLRGRAVAAR